MVDHGGSIETSEQNRPRSLLLSGNLILSMEATLQRQANPGDGLLSSQVLAVHAPPFASQKHKRFRVLLTTPTANNTV